MSLSKVTATASAIIITLLLAPTVFGQTILKTQPLSTQSPSAPTQTTTTPAVRTRTIPQVNTPVSSPPAESLNQTIEDLQKQLQSINSQLKTNQPWVEWFTWWWKIDLSVSLLWFLVWVFIGWQWTNFKFWEFGWPWPWWFWIPIFWFVPWLIVGWFWWPFWWIWWFWIWFWWPWIFWPIWWIILFKEAIIWHFRRRKSVKTD